MRRTAVIKDCRKEDYDPKRPKSEQEVCLYTHDGKELLGRHPNKESAEKQERAIQWRKHGALDKQNKKATSMSSQETTPEMVRYAGHLYIRADEDELPDEPEMEDEEHLEEEQDEVELVDALKEYWQTILDKLPEDLEVDEDFEAALNGIEDVIKILEDMPNEDEAPLEEELPEDEAE